MGSLPSQASPCLQTSSNSWIFRRQLFRRAGFYGPVASQTDRSPASKVPPGYPRAGALWPGSRVAALGLGWRPAAAPAGRGESAENSPPSCSGGFQGRSFARGLLRPYQRQRGLQRCLLWPTGELPQGIQGASSKQGSASPWRCRPQAQKQPFRKLGGGAGSMQQGCPGRGCCGGGLSRTVRGRPLCSRLRVPCPPLPR